MDIQAKTYKLDAMWRRMPYYLLAAQILIIATLYAMEIIAPLEGDSGDRFMHLQKISGVLVLLWAVFAWWIWSWRLRVDDQGVHWRNIYWRTWTWETFQSGGISHVVPFVFQKEPPLKRGTLCLIYMAEQDREKVLDAIATFWMPYVPEIQASLSLNVAKHPLKRKNVTLSESGIETDYSDSMRSYRWEDVLEINITKFHCLQQGLSELQLVLPDETIIFRNNGKSLNWTGATQIELVMYLRRFVWEEKIAEIALNTPQTLDEIDAQLTRLYEARKALLLTSGLSVIIGIVLLILELPQIVQFIQEMLKGPAELVWLMIITMLLLVMGFLGWALVLPLQCLAIQKNIKALLLKRNSLE